MNYPLTTVTVNGPVALADKPICLYTGNANIVATFKVVKPEYRLTRAEEDDLLVSLNAFSYEFTIVRLDGAGKITSSRATITNNQLQYTFNSAFTAAGMEGRYSYQITLFDSAGTAILTLPPVKGGILLQTKL